MNLKEKKSFHIEFVCYRGKRKFFFIIVIYDARVDEQFSYWIQFLIRFDHLPDIYLNA